MKQIKLSSAIVYLMTFDVVRDFSLLKEGQLYCEIPPAD